jgi:hypothetical protein
MSILDDIETKQYGSWVRGEATIEQLLMHMLNSLPADMLASKFAHSKITFIVRPSDPHSIEQDAFSAWKIRYGNKWSDFR